MKIQSAKYYIIEKTTVHESISVRNTTNVQKDRTQKNRQAFAIWHLFLATRLYHNMESWQTTMSKEWDTHKQSPQIPHCDNKRVQEYPTPNWEMMSANVVLQTLLKISTEIVWHTSLENYMND